MATLQTYRPTATHTGFGLSTLFAKIAKWNNRRATIKELNKLSNRELDDIGLSRGDIADITD
ncbi:MAG: DUF1127 domain-containing protein [Marinosulfonomonas sp.]|nr:DUF1127 domain-containing protein [Marinosulfonomonas sp.]